MIRRAIGMSVLSLAVAGLVACGGGDSSPTATAPVPAAPTKAAVTFNVDPNPVISEYQGDSWWRFKVNLEFYDTAGVGFQINSVRTTVSSTVTNTILLDYDYYIARHVNASGRDVLQFTSPLYRTLTGGGASVKFIAKLSRLTGRPAKSLMRMLGPRGNPQARNQFEVIGQLQRIEGLHFELSLRAAS